MKIFNFLHIGESELDRIWREQGEKTPENERKL